MLEIILDDQFRLPKVVQVHKYQQQSTQKSQISVDWIIKIWQGQWVWPDKELVHQDLVDQHHQQSFLETWRRHKMQEDLFYQLFRIIW